jgi:hypothetical protein
MWDRTNSRLAVRSVSAVPTTLLWRTQLLVDDLVTLVKKIWSVLFNNAFSSRDYIVCKQNYRKPPKMKTALLSGTLYSCVNRVTLSCSVSDSWLCCPLHILLVCVANGPERLSSIESVHKMGGRNWFFSDLNSCCKQMHNQEQEFQQPRKLLPTTAHCFM